MYKRYSICVFVMMLMLAACGGRSGGSSHAAAATKTPVSPVAPSAQTYIYYTTGEGLVRSGIMLDRGDIKLIGNSGGFLYYTDSGGMLYKMSENGEQKKLLSAAPVSDAVFTGESLLFVQSGEIVRLNADDSLTALMQIPESILQQPYNLRADGDSLFICTYHERGLGSICKCDLDSGRVVPQLEDVRYSPFVISSGWAYQSQAAGTGNSIFKQLISSGEKETVIDAAGLLYDMSVSGDWLIYLALREGRSRSYVNGLNLASGKTFKLESQCDYIYQTLPSGLLLLDSHSNSMSVLTLSGDGANISAFNQ